MYTFTHFMIRFRDFLALFLRKIFKRKTVTAQKKIHFYIVCVECAVYSVQYTVCSIQCAVLPGVWPVPAPLTVEVGASSPPLKLLPRLSIDNLRETWGKQEQKQTKYETGKK